MNQAIDHATLEAAEALSSTSCAIPRGKPQKCKRIHIDGLPEAVMLRKGGIRFRHYYVSVHAMDRFVERCGRPSSEILVALHDAVLACHERARSASA